MIAATTNLNLHSDKELVALLAADNEDSFNIIYDKYREHVHKVAMRYLKSDNISHEVVQEVFMKLWLERNNIIPTTPIEGWLCTVAKNITLNKLKKVAIEWRAINHLKATQPTFDDATQNRLNDADCNHLLQEALTNLSENQRLVFRLSREENQSYIEIANNLNISPLTVKKHMSRALANLKLFFTGYFF
jgi:RNA polymerase sigma-70 factor (ECF subfamily)